MTSLSEITAPPRAGLRHLLPVTFRGRLTLAVALTHVVLVGLFTLDVVGRQRAFLIEQSRLETASLVRTVALNSGSWVLANDVVGLQEIVQPLLAHPDLRYAMVVSRDGQVLAHTNPALIGHYLTDPESRAPPPSPPAPYTIHAGGGVVDVAAPVVSHKGELLAWARIGQGQDEIERNLRRVAWRGAFFMAAAGVLGAIAALLLARSLTARLAVLLSASTRVAGGRHDFRVDVRGADEVAQLGRGFNEMLEAIRSREAERCRSDAEVKRLNAELERRVAERTAELQTAFGELEAFSYSVSHDLRTPLRAIDGFSRILLEEYGGKLDTEGQRLLEVVRTSTVRMGELIDDILAFSRAGRMAMSSTEIDMGALVRALFDELRAATPSRRLDLEVGALPPARGDPAMLRQVLANLLGNAVKFTTGRDPARVVVSAREEGESVVYAVRDNGVGFDMRYVGKLFGVFQRLHSSQEFEGTGIGLAIVQRIITRHGGRVWAEGVPGEGATFHFTLPRGESR